jgi:hypothetical protein
MLKNVAAKLCYNFALALHDRVFRWSIRILPTLKLVKEMVGGGNYAKTS